MCHGGQQLGMRCPTPFLWDTFRVLEDYVRLSVPAQIWHRTRITRPTKINLSCTKVSLSPGTRVSLSYNHLSGFTPRAKGALDTGPSVSVGQVCFVFRPGQTYMEFRWEWANISLRNGNTDLLSPLNCISLFVEGYLVT